jgi:hypothetical protein
MRSLFEETFPAGQPVGGTPRGATETVALPWLATGAALKGRSKSRWIKVDQGGSSRKKRVFEYLTLKT